jgi:hypothetical protein
LKADICLRSTLSLSFSTRLAFSTCLGRFWDWRIFIRIFEGLSIAILRPQFHRISTSALSYFFFLQSRHFSCVLYPNDKILQVSSFFVHAILCFSQFMCFVILCKETIRYFLGSLYKPTNSYFSYTPSQNKMVIVFRQSHQILQNLIN